MALLKGFNKNSLERLKAGLSHPAACASSESPAVWFLCSSSSCLGTVALRKAASVCLYSDMASSLDP